MKRRNLFLATAFLLIGLASCHHRKDTEHLFSLNQGNAWINDYSTADPVRGWLMDTRVLKDFMKASKPDLIHFSLALDSFGRNILIASGVQCKKNTYSHTYDNGSVLISGYACPGCYDPNNTEAQGTRVSNGFDSSLQNATKRDIGDTVFAGSFRKIAIADANRLIKAYLNRNPQSSANNPVGWLVPVSWIDEITKNDACAYIHLSKGTKIDADIRSNVLILAGVDRQYNHLYLGADGKVKDKDRTKKSQLFLQSSNLVGGVGTQNITEGSYPCPFCIDMGIGGAPEQPTGTSRASDTLEIPDDGTVPDQQ